MKPISPARTWIFLPRTTPANKTEPRIEPCFFRLGVQLICVCLLIAFGPQVLSAGDLRAGLARIDITPTQPVRLAGYASRKELSQGVHDPLSARVLAFEQNGQRLVLVSTDNLGFYGGTAEPARKAIMDACGLKPSELFLCAIHTHSAPSLTLDATNSHANNVEYTKWLQGRLVEVVRTALERLAPAEIAVASGSSPVGVSRREVGKDKDGNPRILLGRNPDVQIDREVQVLKLVRPEGKKLAGVLFAYDTHSTSLGPDNYIVSGDVHGLAEQFLERYLGNDVVAPGFAGASGNIDPWVRILPGFRTENGWVPEPVLMGTMLGEEVGRVLERTSECGSKTPIQSAIKTVELPGKPRGEAPASSPSTSPIKLTVARLGDIAFVGLGGEVFNEIGKAIKSGSPFPYTFVFTHCNGTAGYVPIRSSYPEGGYEVQSSAFAPGAGEQLAQEAIRLLKDLQ